jgi:hypothetical protein
MWEAAVLRLKKNDVMALLDELMKADTAGNPMSGKKWSRKDTRSISREMKMRGVSLCPNTAGKLLRCGKYSLRVNRKSIAETQHPDRNRQFELIAEFRKRFEDAGCSILSVDTTKKELVGPFKNNGRLWSREGLPVNDHDFPSLAKGIAIPRGLYDLAANRASVLIGTSHDTPEFAVDAIVEWWRRQGRRRYDQASELLILADSGGSNGARRRLWKCALQEKLADRFQLAVTVCHYPTGASKWNPVEHRLFSEISKHWAGQPLIDYPTIVRLIGETKTQTGLRVHCALTTKDYPTKIKVSDEQMGELDLLRHPLLPDWNYTLLPRTNRN